MKWYSGALGGAVSLGVSIGVRTWMRTLRYQMSYYDPAADPVNPNFEQPGIYVFWHEYIPFMFYLRGHNDVAMLLSQHKDAETLARATRYVGFGTVRGSTNRGGLSALRKMFRDGGRINLTMTPDGPRGPRRTLAPGCVYLASRLQIPIVPLGLGYDRPWRISRAWDKFAVPRPGSSARAVMGPQIYIPKKADRDQLELHRQQLESNLNDLTAAAEAWAEGGPAVGCPFVVKREPRALPWRKASNNLQLDDESLPVSAHDAKLRLSA